MSTNLVLNYDKPSRMGTWTYTGGMSLQFVYLVVAPVVDAVSWPMNPTTIEEIFQAGDRWLSEADFARTRLVSYGSSDNQELMNQGWRPFSRSAGSGGITGAAEGVDRKDIEYTEGCFIPGNYALYAYQKFDGKNVFQFIDSAIVPATATSGFSPSEDPDSFIVDHLQFYERHYEAFALVKGRVFNGEVAIPSEYLVGSIHPSAGLNVLFTEHLPIGAELEEEVEYYAHAKIHGKWWSATGGVPVQKEIPEPEPPVEFNDFILYNEVQPTVVPNITITPPSGTMFTEGFAVQVTTTPPPIGWRFVGWRGDDQVVGGQNLSFEVIMTKTKTVRAVYDKIRYPVNITTIGDGYTSFNGTVYVAHGESLSVTATPNNYSEFDSWGGTLASDSILENSISINNVQTPRTIVANFKKQTGTLILTSGTACRGFVKLKNLQNNTEKIVSPVELANGFSQQLPYGTPFELEAYGDGNNSQFLKYSSGSEFRKRIPVDGSFVEADTTDDDPVQYFKSFIPSPSTNEKVIDISYFCSPDDSPVPRWSYSIECPVPTVEEGIDPDFEPTPSQTEKPLITTVEYNDLEQCFRITWRMLIDNTTFDKYPLAVIIQYHFGDGQWLNGVPLQSFEQVRSGQYADLPLPKQDVNFRVIVYGGFNQGITDTWNYVVGQYD